MDLTFNIDEKETTVTSVLTIRKNPAVEVETIPLVLDKGEFVITSVIAGGMVLLPEEYESADTYFKLSSTPDVFKLEITSVLKPHENTSLEGLYTSGDVLCTQCEAQGFRKITPFLDRPDVMAIYSCTIIADKSKYPVLLSNGNLVKAGDLKDNRHFVRWEDPFKNPVIFLLWLLETYLQFLTRSLRLLGDRLI